MFGIQDIHRDTKRLTMSIHSDISLVDVVNIFFSLSRSVCLSVRFEPFPFILNSSDEEKKEFSRKLLPVQ